MSLVNSVATALLVCFGITACFADDRAEKKDSDLRKQLLGAWVLVGEPGTDAEPEPGARMKFFGEKHWFITEADPTTGQTVYHHGGTYTLTDDFYVESLTFANENTADMIGSEFEFTIEIKGDRYIQSGLGNPFTEEWKRLSASE